MGILGVIALAALLQAAPVPNPTKVVFNCPDHAQDTNHEIDIVTAAGVVVQTIQAGDPPADANGDVTVQLNVQPIKFGTYTVRVRVVADQFKSEDAPSPQWVRVPGKPTNVRIGG